MSKKLVRLTVAVGFLAPLVMAAPALASTLTLTVSPTSYSVSDSSVEVDMSGSADSNEWISAYYFATNSTCPATQPQAAATSVGSVYSPGEVGPGQFNTIDFLDPQAPQSYLICAYLSFSDWSTDQSARATVIYMGSPASAPPSSNPPSSNPTSSNPPAGSGTGSPGGGSSSGSNSTKSGWCSSAGLRGVTHLWAGVAPGGYYAYRAQCGGARDAAQSYVRSGCSRASRAFQRAHGHYRICGNEFDDCVVKQRLGRRQATVWCVPRLNQNALVKFQYKFFR